MQKNVQLSSYGFDFTRKFRLFELLALLFLASLSSHLSAELVWTRGWVSRIVRGIDLNDINQRECIKGLSKDDIAAQNFIVVAYGGFHGRKHITVAAPSNLNLVLGEPVWVDLKDCHSPLRKRADVSTRG